MRSMNRSSISTWTGFCGRCAAPTCARISEDFLVEQAFQPVVLVCPEVATGNDRLESLFHKSNRSAAADCWDEMDLAGLLDLLEQAADRKVAVDRDRH